MSELAQFGWNFGLAMAAPYTFFVFVFSYLVVAEIALGRSAMTLEERLRGAKYWAILVPIDAAAIYLGSRLRDAAGIAPVLEYEMDLGSAALGAVGAALAADFLFYWFHRFQHRFLWRFHSVHHSIENLSATNSYHHWSEPFWNVALVATPLAFLDVRTVEQAAFLSFILRAYPYYIHSPIKVHVGPLSAVLVDNRFHRVHHSRDSRHFDKNFGALTTIWDRLFGTAYFPGKDEWPDVGIEAHREPRTVCAWLAAGDRRRRSTLDD